MGSTRRPRRCVSFEDGSCARPGVRCIRHEHPAAPERDVRHGPGRVTPRPIHGPWSAPRRPWPDRCRSDRRGRRRIAARRSERLRPECGGGAPLSAPGKRLQRQSSSPEGSLNAAFLIIISAANRFGRHHGPAAISVPDRDAGKMVTRSVNLNRRSVRSRRWTCPEGPWSSPAAMARSAPARRRRDPRPGAGTEKGDAGGLLRRPSRLRGRAAPQDGGRDQSAG